MKSVDQVSQDMAPTPGSAALVLRQQMTVVTQVLLVVVALPCLLPFYRLIILADDQVQELARPRGDIALVLLAIGVTTLAVALSRPSRTVTFYPLAREMVVLPAGTFGLRWQHRYSFCDLGSVTVARATDVAARACYRVEIRCLICRRPIKIGDFADERQAREVAGTSRQ